MRTCRLNPPSCVQSSLPGSVNDCFYAYMPLDYDDGASGNPPKSVILVIRSWGCPMAERCNCSARKALPTARCRRRTQALAGRGWRRPTAAGTTALTLDRIVDWVANDNIVLSTTDYLPAHSEQLIVASNDTSKGYSVITSDAGADGSVRTQRHHVRFRSGKCAQRHRPEPGPATWLAPRRKPAAWRRAPRWVC